MCVRQGTSGVAGLAGGLPCCIDACMAVPLNPAVAAVHGCEPPALLYTYVPRARCRLRPARGTLSTSRPPATASSSCSAIPTSSGSCWQIPAPLA